MSSTLRRELEARRAALRQTGRSESVPEDDDDSGSGTLGGGTTGRGTRVGVHEMSAARALSTVEETEGHSSDTDDNIDTIPLQNIARDKDNSHTGQVEEAAGQAGVHVGMYCSVRMCVCVCIFNFVRTS